MNSTSLRGRIVGLALDRDPDFPPLLCLDIETERPDGSGKRDIIPCVMEGSAALQHAPHLHLDAEVQATGWLESDGDAVLVVVGRLVVVREHHPLLVALPQGPSCAPGGMRQPC